MNAKSPQGGAEELVTGDARAGMKNCAREVGGSCRELKNLKPKGPATERKMKNSRVRVSQLSEYGLMKGR